MSTASTSTRAPAPPRGTLFTNRNFRWLLAGGVVSMLGEQFTLIALPWLVLRLTGDTLTLGIVIAVTSLPRAAFVLVGGAFVDRHSPRQVLLLSKLVNAALLALLALLVWRGTLAIAMLYAIAAAIGLTTAFSYPASSALLPQAVPADTLPGANGALMSLRQLTMLLGPVLAGVLIGVSGQRDVHAAHAVADARGLTLAFALDALSFALSAATLVPVRLRARDAHAHAAGVVGAIGEALRAFWNDKALRTLCLYLAAVSVFVGGPIQVALPVFASRQLPGGAAALGLLSTGHGAGVLVGMLLSGARPTWRIRTLGTTMLAMDATAGLCLVAFGRITATWQGLLLLAFLGTCAGFIQVAVFTWMQRRVAPAMLGRTMSLFMFIFLGVAPLSAAAAGAVMRWLSPTALFAASGATLTAFALLGLCFATIRRIEDGDTSARKTDDGITPAAATTSA